jgi:thioredoxin-related protein
MLRRRFAVFAALSVLLGCRVAHAAEDIGYDSRANAAAQLAEGVAHAKAEDKLVLAIAGGDWCIWCHYLNAFVKKNADVEKALYDTFVIVKVYYGDDNKNERFFSSWPKADGYPHFWVFSGDGNLLASQPTLPLEDGDKSYDKDRFLAFVARWKNPE